MNDGLPVRSNPRAYSEINERLHRAARNGARLHLDQDHVQALLADEIYERLSALEAAELRNSLCKDVLPLPAWRLLALVPGRSRGMVHLLV